MKRILIIENNKEDAQKYKNAISSIGFHTQIAESAIKGLKILDEESFDLILLNIFLSDMHGLSLIQKIKNKNPHLKTQFIILTELTDDEIIKEAYSLPVNGYLIKSHYSPEQIADYIKTSLFLSR